MTVWFTSGQQFGRDGISTKRSRSYDTVDEMDEGLIARWNEIVDPHDEVWHLGDFAHTEDEDRLKHVLARLNANRIRFIMGSIDGGTNRPRFHKLRDNITRIEIEKQDILLSNDFGATGLCSRGGSIWLFGFRNQWWETSASCSVHVDAWDFGPVSLEQIVARLKRRTSPPR